MKYEQAFEHLESQLFRQKLICSKIVGTRLINVTIP